MMNKGKLAAINLRNEIGIEGPDEIELEDVIIGRGGFVKYMSMGKIDGRIVYGKSISTVFINSDIKYEGRRRFALAHELGHLEMHKGSKIHDDGASLNWFNEMETKLKRGNHEYEANQFATEFLMPMDSFKKSAKGKKLSPQLIRDLATEYNTSLTSVAFRYFEADLFPMAMFHIFKGKVRYWKRSSDLRGYIKNITKLPPPEDSLATEYITANYDPLYKQDELAQPIDKSTWFTLNEGEEDKEFFEYCIVTKSYNNILSLVWEV